MSLSEYTVKVKGRLNVKEESLREKFDLREKFRKRVFLKFQHPLHPRRPQPSAQPSSLIPSGFFSPPISSTPLPPPSAGKLADR